MDIQDMESNVYIGAWTNWSRGAVMGRTLTLTRSHGNLLIAFTASFVAFVAARFWRIVAIVCHRCYSNPRARTTLHHQRQLTLRNSSSPETAFFSFLGLAYAWRRTGVWRLLGLAPLIGLAVLTTVAFTLAGGFSSTIATAVGDTVLLMSNHCGFPYMPPEASAAGAALSSTADKANTAANYAQQCYSTGRSSGILDCDRFVQDHISWDVDSAAPCPFSPEMCRSKSNNLRLDTGPMDVNAILGLNEAADQRTTLRYVLHCAPVVTEGFRSTVPAPEGNGTLVRYAYGDRPQVQGGENYNYTYQVRNIASQYQHLGDDSGEFLPTNFLVEIMASVTANGIADESSHFFPIASLARSDADVALVFLSGNGIVFHQAIQDDWYQATTEEGTILVTGAKGSAPYYVPDEAATPLGCVEQYQYCNIGANNDSGSQQKQQEPSCGPLASFNDAMVYASPVFNSSAEEVSSGTLKPPYNNADLTRLNWIADIWSQGLGLSQLIQFLAAKSLASQSSLYGGIQYSTAAEDGSGSASPEWKSDVTSWFATILGSLQAAFVSTVIGPAGGVMADYRYPPVGEAQEELCNSQKIRSTKHTSFSVFGLGFAYALGGVILLVSAVVEPALRLCSRRWSYREYEEVEWVTNNYYQLHRLVHEGVEHVGGEAGKWKGCRDNIPVTERDELLGVLDVQDRSRPRIVRARDGEEGERCGVKENSQDGAGQNGLEEGDGGQGTKRKGDGSDVHVMRVDSDISGSGPMSSPAVSESGQRV